MIENALVYLDFKERTCTVIECEDSTLKFYMDSMSFSQEYYGLITGELVLKIFVKE